MRACCSGVAPVLLTLWGSRAAQQNRDFLLRAQRALKEGVVIRKRQGEPWFPLLLCACGAQPRICRYDLAYTARRVVAQASFSCRCAAIHLLAPYDTCVQRHRILLARNARPYEKQTADGSPGGEIPSP